MKQETKGKSKKVVKIMSNTHLNSGLFFAERRFFLNTMDFQFKDVHLLYFFRAKKLMSHIFRPMFKLSDRLNYLIDLTDIQKRIHVQTRISKWLYERN